MKTKYKRFNIYLKDEFERTLLNMRQELSSRTDWSIFDRNWTLMKLKRNNINKAMKRLQLYMSRNITIDESMARMIKKEYEEHNNV